MTSIAITKKAPEVFTPGALIYMNPSKDGMVIGSPARTRTTDTVVNSHLLCRLSYWGRKINLLKTNSYNVKDKNNRALKS